MIFRFFLSLVLILFSLKNCTLIKGKEAMSLEVSRKIYKIHNRSPSLHLPIGKRSVKISGNHLFVLVHGFQGNSHDMRLFKDNIALRYPEAMFLCTQQN